MNTIKQYINNISSKKHQEEHKNNKFHKDFFSHSIEERQRDAAKALQKYQDKLPCVVIRGTNDTPEIKNHKFILPIDMTMGQFMVILRKYINPNENSNNTDNSDKALFLFVGESLTIPKSSSTIAEIYQAHKGEDNFLKIIYTCESTFG